MQYYFKRSFVLHSSKVIISFLIKKSRQKAIEIRTAFFHPLGNAKGRTLNRIFYAPHICHKFPYKLIPISVSLVEIFLNSLSAFNNLDMGRVCLKPVARHSFPQRPAPWAEYSGASMAPMLRGGECWQA